MNVKCPICGKDVEKQGTVLVSVLTSSFSLGISFAIWILTFGISSYSYVPISSPRWTKYLYVSYSTLSGMLWSL